MVEWYFYLEKGKAKGPLDKKDVLRAFEKGQLGPLDLIYKEGAEKWVPAFEVREFSSLFKDAPKKDFIETSRRSWIILQKKEEAKDGRGFRQSGPYSLSELKDKIHSGQVSYQDYVWKSGFKKWTKLKDLPEFNSKAGAASADSLKLRSIHPDEHIDKALESVHFREISKEHLFEAAPPHPEVPPEAVTKDLTRPWEQDIEINIIEPEGVSSGTVRPHIVKHKTAADSQEITIEIHEGSRRREPEGENPRQWVWRLVVFGASVLAVTVAFIFLSRPLVTEAPSRKVRQKTPPPVERVRAPTPPVEPPPPAKVEVPRKEPQQLSAMVSSGGIDIKTDGSFHFPVRLRLFGQAGSVSASSGIYREALVKFTDSQAPRWTPGSLVDGDYILEIRQAQLVKVQGIKWRGEEKGFSSREARKRQAPQFNRDRRDLAQLALELAKLSQELEQNFVRQQKNPSAWREFYSAWLRNKKRMEAALGLEASLSSRALPWSWAQMQSSASALLERAELYDQNLRTGRDNLSGRKNRDLSREFSTMRTDILALRLF